MIIQTIMRFIVAVVTAFASLSSSVLPLGEGTSAEGSAVSVFEDARPLYTELPANAQPATTDQLAVIRSGTWVPAQRPTTMAIEFGATASSEDFANAEFFDKEIATYPDLQEFSVRADCNPGFGVVWFDEATMHVANLVSTMKGCLPLETKRGQELMPLLDGPTVYVTDGDTSAIYLAAGDKVAKFVRG